MDDDEFIERLREVLGGDDFDDKVKKFMRKNAKPVVTMCTEGQDTGSIEAYDIFKQYLALYENQLEDFQEECNMTAVQLKNRLENILKSNIMAKFMIKYLLMALEFKAFVDYCKIYANEDECEDEDEDSGKSEDERHEGKEDDGYEGKECDSRNRSK